MYELDDTSVTATNYGISSSFARLDQDDKARVKMLQIFDDELSRVFFSERVVIVEGDSEILAIKNTICLLPEDICKYILSSYQVVKARGKASIISLVRYLQDLQIFPLVIHDRDKGIAGSEVFNKPISIAVGDPDRLIVLEEDLETVLGYQPPTSDKPYKAYVKTKEWNNHTEISQQWRLAFSKLFDIEWPL